MLISLDENFKREFPHRLAVQAVALSVTEPQTAQEEPMAFNFIKTAAPKVLPKRAMIQLLLYRVN